MIKASELGNGQVYRLQKASAGRGSSEQQQVMMNLSVVVARVLQDNVLLPLRLVSEIKQVRLYLLRKTVDCTSSGKSVIFP